MPLLILVVVTDSIWPLFIPAIAFGIAWGLWQQYKYQQLLRVANPEFQRLIQTHQGKITVADLTRATGMSGHMAQWFLSQKAKEYGARMVTTHNFGVVYHFLTANALENMLNNSTPDMSTTSIT